MPRQVPAHTASEVSADESLGLNGPRLVLLAAFVLGVASVGVLATRGADREVLGLLLRASARISLVLFLLAFAASGLRRLWRHPVTAWLLRNRRYVGLSFAVSHTYHLLFIVALNVRFSVDNPLGLLLGGGAGYVALAGMALTSNDASQRRLGMRGWSALQRVGLYTLWLIFASVYFPAVTTTLGAGMSALLVAAMVVRWRA